jgi:hypothetical protein
MRPQHGRAARPAEYIFFRRVDDRMNVDIKTHTAVESTRTAIELLNQLCFATADSFSRNPWLRDARYTTSHK